MATRIHALDQGNPHAAFPPLPVRGKTAAGSAPASTNATASTSTAEQGAEAPSFSAVIAQMAAAAAAAGTTVASIAPVSAPATSAAAPAVTTGWTAATDAPAGPLFGANPWISDPTGKGPNGVVTQYNPIYFATQQTAQTVAQMIGGTVVQSNQMVPSPGSPFTLDQLNYMVQMPDGALVNPGLVADIYAHGWSQSMINQQVANEVSGDEAAFAAQTNA